MGDATEEEKRLRLDLDTKGSFDGADMQNGGHHDILIMIKDINDHYDETDGRVLPRYICGLAFNMLRPLELPSESGGVAFSWRWNCGTGRSAHEFPV